MSLLNNLVVRVPRLPISPMLRGSPQVTQLSNDGSLSCGSGRCQRSGGCDLSENDKNRKFSIHLQRLDGASGFGVNGETRVGRVAKKRFQWLQVVRIPAECGIKSLKISHFSRY